ncbi:MAG TPA: CvpA family protein [Actinomycetota bacterium]|nr:CvpA family protein [Actinomycetota bacterium]
MFLFIDTLILGLIAALVRTGWRRGFASQAIDLMGFTLALLLSLRFAGAASAPFRLVGFRGATATLLGALLIFAPLIVAVAVVGARANRLVMHPGLHMTNRICGVGFGLAFAVVVMTFVLLITQAAPVPQGLSQAARKSPMGRVLLSSASPATRLLQGVADRDADKLILYLRQSLRSLRSNPDEKPEVDEPPALRFPAVPEPQIRLDAAAEKELLKLVNEERTSRKLKPVKWDQRLADVARSHSRDMYTKGYFAHASLEGIRPSERLQKAKIGFVVSGENLALAPTVPLAHRGLMNSPGHKRNILDPDFSALGIGIFNGPKGLIASQEFCGGC